MTPITSMDQSHEYWFIGRTVLGLDAYCSFLQKQKFRTISFHTAPLHRMCDAMTLLHAQHTHSPELPRSVGRDVNDVTSVTLLSREFIFKQFMSTERREHAHCNEHKLVSRDSQFPWCLSYCFWYTGVIQDVAR
jgi:hypothetical protein